jgi:hypothetical protein
MIAKYLYIDYGNGVVTSNFLPTHFEGYVKLDNSNSTEKSSIFRNLIIYQFYKVRFLKIKKDRKRQIAFELLNGFRNFTHFVIISKRFAIKSKDLSCVYDDHYKVYIGRIKKVIRFSVVDYYNSPLFDYYIKYNKTNKKVYMVLSSGDEEI